MIEDVSVLLINRTGHFAFFSDDILYQLVWFLSLNCAIMLSKIQFTAIVSLGIIDPSAICRACNGTLGAIHKVHLSAS